MPTKTKSDEVVKLRKALAAYRSANICLARRVKNLETMLRAAQHWRDWYKARCRVTMPRWAWLWVGF